MSTDLIDPASDKIRGHAVALMIATKSILAEIDTGRLLEAAAKARNLQEALKELGDRLARAAGLEETLQELAAPTRSVEETLKEACDRFSRLGIIEETLKATCDRLAATRSVEETLKELSVRLANLGSVEATLKELSDRFSRTIGPAHQG